MSSSATAEVVIGVKVEDADLYTKTPPRWRCSNGHDVDRKHRHCPGCGLPASMRPGRDYSPLMHAMSSALGYDDPDDVWNMADERYDEDALALTPMGPSYSTECEAGWVLGFQFATPRGGRMDRSEAEMASAIKAAGALATAAGLDPLLVRLHVAWWKH